MRINHNREREMLRTIAPLLSEEQNTAAESFSRYRPLFTRYRISRFFRTLQGFHTVGQVLRTLRSTLRCSLQGCLDLTGRHQARYKSLLKRWGDFSRDLAQVINVFLAPIPTHSDTWDEDDDDDLLSLPIQPGSEDLLHAFGKKWRLEATSKSAMQHVLMLFGTYSTQNSGSVQSLRAINRATCDNSGAVTTPRLSKDAPDRSTLRTLAYHFEFCRPTWSTIVGFNMQIAARHLSVLHISRRLCFKT